MLKSLNFTVFKCMECGEAIKVQPSTPVEPLLHECKKAKAPVKDTAKKPSKAKETKAVEPKANEDAKKKGFMGFGGE